MISCSRGATSHREVFPDRRCRHPGPVDRKMVDHRRLRPGHGALVPGRPSDGGALPAAERRPGPLPPAGRIPRRFRPPRGALRGHRDGSQGPRAGDRGRTAHAHASPGEARKVPVPAVHQRRFCGFRGTLGDPDGRPTAAAASQPSLMTDLLLVNGNIRTMDPARPRARSIACTGGLIESLDEAPPARRVLDLEGKTVIPGIIDAHVHLLACGRRKRELDLSGVTDYEALIQRVLDRANATPPGAWITGSGYELDGHPHHARLSAATPDHPVWLVRKDAHSGLANARAMALADLSVVPPGGAVLGDQGVFLENAQGLISRLLPAEAPAASFLAAQRDAIQAGITGIHDAMVDEDYLRVLLSLNEGRSLRLRVHAMFWHEDPDRVIDFMQSQKPKSGRLSLRAIKLFMDGSLGSSTAWMTEPYCGTDSRGLSTLDLGDAERVCRAALATGWQVCAHAIGDRANRELLGIYERVGPPPQARWRIEHAQHVHPSDLGRFGPYIASVQPSHCVADRKMIERRLGPGRYLGCHAW